MKTTALEGLDKWSAWALSCTKQIGRLADDFLFLPSSLSSFQTDKMGHRCLSQDYACIHTYVLNTAGYSGVLVALRNSLELNESRNQRPWALCCPV